MLNVLPKLVPIGAAFVAFGVLGSTSVLADVEAVATYTKTKDITVTETIDIDKFVDLNATVIALVDKAAESDAVVNQTNSGNEACGNCAEKADVLRGSGNDNSGVMSINNAAGNMNNQGNVVAAAVDAIIVPDPDDPPPPTPDNGTGFAESATTVDQRNTDNTVDTVNLLFRDAFIVDSLNNNSGIAHANQASGNMNNQANAVSLAVSFDNNGVALAEADLGQLNTGNQNFESAADDAATFGVVKDVLMTGSVNGNSGIVGVNQTSGNLANQANVVSFSAVRL